MAMPSTMCRGSWCLRFQAALCAPRTWPFARPSPMVHPTAAQFLPTLGLPISAHAMLGDAMLGDAMLGDAISGDAISGTTTDVACMESGESMSRDGSMTRSVGTNQVSFTHSKHKSTKRGMIQRCSKDERDDWRWRRTLGRRLSQHIEPDAPMSSGGGWVVMGFGGEESDGL